ncbi:MAG: dihydroxy-acid dehydratase, partial [Gammaproteobacteria bacterium]
MKDRVLEVTARIEARSHHSRAAYLGKLERRDASGPRRRALSCGNLAHVTAACPQAQKTLLSGESGVNIGIVSAYNDMLSAHQPYRDVPELLKAELAGQGASGQVGGGVPAMCDGITQGRGGMELSLFSRDVIAMATGIALSHEAFDGMMLLGVCDKIVPG